jgi:hypothetical protein
MNRDEGPGLHHQYLIWKLNQDGHWPPKSVDAIVQEYGGDEAYDKHGVMIDEAGAAALVHYAKQERKTANKKTRFPAHEEESDDDLDEGEGDSEDEDEEEEESEEIGGSDLNGDRPTLPKRRKSAKKTATKKADEEKRVKSLMHSMTIGTYRLARR